MRVIWRKKAVDELEAVYNYIKKDSPQNAIMVFNKILEVVESLTQFPFKYPVEPIINIEKVRYAVIWSYKIVYSIEKESIVVLRIFNTKQSPKKLKRQ